MSATAPSASSPAARWLDSYAADHRHPANVAIHTVCVPVILWTVIALLWLVPVPVWLGRPGFWAGVGMFLAMVFYLRLSRTLALAMFAVFVLLGLATEGLYRVLGAPYLLWLAAGVFVLAWIMQFVGHLLEGQRPSFLTDLTYLLVGPAWVVAKLLRRAGMAV